ncbi:MULTISPECIES: ATP-dependent zinc protease family protein [Oceanimonas]|uniref:ATP-dependent zinc protease n=1 Tax=Oceanimonas smirnovii TaxID=264574 RepID=A0ABW7P354_9GAMM
MKKAALSLLTPLLLSACAGQFADTPPPPQPVSHPELNDALNNQEARLITAMEQQNTRLSTNHHAFMTALQQEIRHLKKQIAATQPATTPAPVNPPAVNNTPDNETRDGKLIVGETEDIWLDAVNDMFPARIDTGATTSSLSAQDITEFERDGKAWVSFNMAHEGVDEKLPVEAPLVRHVRIRQASAEEPERRPVVELTLRMGRLTEKTEFTLADRSQMTYPVLLGREFLKDIAVVDIARRNAQGKPKRPIPSDE